MYSSKLSDLVKTYLRPSHAIFVDLFYFDYLPATKKVSLFEKFFE